MQPLKGIRILDLTTINPFTDTEFSDYGAEVIKVERPGSGDTIRDYPPFIDGVSAYHCYTDRGKKSITLNLKDDQGKEILKRLVKDADILVENFKNGTMEKMGLGFEELSKINPALVYGKLSSYGSVGPQKDYIAYDIAVQAQSGIMDATGEPEGEPSRVGCYVSDHLSCTYLGTAIVLALYHAKKTGKGQRVEVSMLDSVASVMGEKVAALNCGENSSRTGHLHDAWAPYDILPCADGWVALAVTRDSQWTSFCQAFGKPEWAERYPTNDARRAAYLGELRPQLTELLANVTRADFDARCAAAGVPAGPVNTMEEAIESPHLKARNMLPTVVDQRVGDVLTVGKVIKFGEGTEDRFTTAPLLGQNNDEILGAHYTKEELAHFQADGVIYGGGDMEHVLSEIKVLDLTASLPGAFCTMNLGDCGAQVVKVELPGGDPNRARGPLKNGASAFFAGLNRNKKSLCLDYTKPEGRELLLKLAASCDVVVTDDPSILDYEAAKAANPGVIYAAITGFGESGPLKDHLADDLILTAMSGMMDRTGRRGEPPMMPGVDFGGTYSGLALLSGIVMALFHKLTSGEGTKIEVSVLDCIFYMLELFVMNYSIDGKIVPKNGNQDTEVAPLGTFAAQDGYAAIAISSEGQWKKFCALVGADQLVDDPRFADNASRLANLEELIPEIGKITGAWKKDELVAAMGASKLAGGALKSVEEMVHDPQIRAAEMIVNGQDPVLGSLYRVGTPMKLGATPLDVTAMPAPALGQHTEEILHALGVSGPKIAELTQAGVVSQHTFSIRSANQNMKAIVCVKQVPDTSGKVAVNPDGTLNRASMQTITNPDDMNAVEAALRLKDETGCKVVVVTMGPPPAEGMLRELLAMGADEAVLVSAREFGGSDTYATSQILSAAIKKIGLDKDDVIFCGRQAIDGDTAQVGPQIAEKLGLPQISYVADVTREGDKVVCKRMLEDGYMVVETTTPCLLTCIKELNDPRYMSMQGISECYDKPYTVLDFEALKDDPLIDLTTIGLKGSPTNIFKSFTPPQKGTGMMLEGSGRETTDKLAGILAAKHVI